MAVRRSSQTLTAIGQSAAGVKHLKITTGPFRIKTRGRLMNDRITTRRVGTVTALAICFTFVTSSLLSAQTQGMNPYPNDRTAEVVNSSQVAGPTFQSTLDFLTQKAVEDEEELAKREKQLRAFGNHGSFPEQFRELYFGRVSSKPPSRQYGR